MEPSTNGHRGFTAHGTNELMSFFVVGLLTVGFVWKFLFGSVVDFQVYRDYKEVFIFVLGIAFGAQAMSRGVDKGTSAALTPAPTPPSTTISTKSGEALPPGGA
jgi:hypothetical protein